MNIYVILVIPYVPTHATMLSLGIAIGRVLPVIKTRGLKISSIYFVVATRSELCTPVSESLNIRNDNRTKKDHVCSKHHPNENKDLHRNVKPTCSIINKIAVHPNHHHGQCPGNSLDWNRVGEWSHDVCS